MILLLLLLLIIITIIIMRLRADAELRAVEPRDGRPLLAQEEVEQAVREPEVYVYIYIYIYIHTHKIHITNK